MSGQGTKRKQRSGLTGVELEVAILALDQLAKKSREEMQRNQGQNEEIDNVPLVDKDEEASVLDKIEALRRVLEARTVGPQARSISILIKNEFLEAMNIRRSGTLELKVDASDLAAKMDSIGSDSLWTLDLLFNHLLHLEKLVPRSNEAAARLWINAYFYRISAMIPEGQKMGLSIEQVVPSVTLSNRSLHTVSGYIYYTASPENLPAFLDAPILRPDDSLLFVSEAKDFVDLGRHIPQAIAEMLGCARRSK
ncbi:hypothetical protein ONZ45_g12474 [Pleurotus djamor]|nr:hypothetical protein ONZ45_g12474 [Pleurotus djamor]